MQNFATSKRYFLGFCLVGLLAGSMNVYAEKSISDRIKESVQAEEKRKAEEQAAADAARKKAAEAAAKRKAEAAKKQPPPESKPVPVQNYALTVKTEPANATVSIRNIKPKYHDGIQLATGKYQIRVSASGYQTQDKWIELGKANKMVTFALKKLPPPPESVAVTPVAPAPAPVAKPQVSSPPATTSQNRIAGRYIDNGNSTITDTQTKLMWKKCSEGQSGNACNGDASNYKWDDAMSRFGQGVSFAGYNDWRMPTKEELRLLVYCSNGTPASVAWDSGCGNGGKAGDYQRPTINLQAFPNTPEYGVYWSSTPEDASVAWVVFFGYGDDGWGGRDDGFHVRLVRSGQ